MDKIGIGKKLRILRNEKGKTLECTADEIGISRSALAMYEQGKRIPRDEVKVAISKYYERSVEEIFFAS